MEGQLYDGKWELPETYPDPGEPPTPKHTHMLVKAHLHREERCRNAPGVGFDILPQSHGYLGLM